MLKINISFKFQDMDFTFQAEVEAGKPYTFEIGEEALADKLFYVLIGLDRDYKGQITGGGVNWSHSRANNVLALGDKTMFVRGSVRKNLYKAFRVRANRICARERTEIALTKFNLDGDKNVKGLDAEQLLRLVLARAHFRDIKLVATKSRISDEILFANFAHCYIIKIL